MRLRWRLLLTLAFAGLLPIIPLLLTVSSVVDTSTRALTPEYLSAALDSSISLATRTYFETTENQKLKLENIIKNSGKFDVNLKLLSELTDSTEALYRIKNNSWKKFNPTNISWESGTPPQSIDTGNFQSLPDKIITRDNENYPSWILVKNIDPSFHHTAELLRKTAAGMASRKMEHDRLITSLIGTYLLTYLIVVALSLIAGHIVMAGATKRISRLTDTAQNVADGDESVRADVVGKDEVTNLSQSFNLMLDRLQESRNRVTTVEKMAAWRELARVLAHEIKNPLTPIQLSVQQLAESDPGNDEKFSSLIATTREIVDEEIESLRNLVKEFSEFARAPRISPIEDSPLELQKDLEALYAGRLQIEASEVMEKWIFDREKVKRALINLLENAFMSGSDDPKVILRLSKVSDMVLFEVEDNGTGISEDQAEKIFEPYFTTKRSGVGLGLPIVKTIAEQHNGSVKIENGEILGGALFIFSIGMVSEKTEDFQE